MKQWKWNGDAQNFISIRKGTHPKIAFRKSMRILWDYLLSNSKSFKLDKGVYVNLSTKREENERTA